MWLHYPNSTMRIFFALLLKSFLSMSLHFLEHMSPSLHKVSSIWQFPSANPHGLSGLQQCLVPGPPSHTNVSFMQQFCFLVYVPVSRSQFLVPQIRSPSQSSSKLQ